MTEKLQAELYWCAFVEEPIEFVKEKYICFLGEGGNVCNEPDETFIPLGFCEMQKIKAT